MGRRRPGDTAETQNAPPEGRGARNGADEIRTHNLLDATEALSQLSYCPNGSATGPSPGTGLSDEVPGGTRGARAVRSGDYSTRPLPAVQSA